MFCMIFAALAMLSYDGEQIYLKGFFQGYNSVVYIALIFQVNSLLYVCNSFCLEAYFY